MRYLRTLYKWNRLIFVAFIIVYIKYTLIDYSYEYGYEKECFRISIIKTNKIRCSLNTMYYGIDEISLNIFNIFLYIKAKILILYQQNNLSNNYINSLLFNEKKLNNYEMYLYKQTGIYHLLVISGMHISILVNIFENVLSKVLKKNKTLKISIMIIMIFYLFFVKISFPVLFQVLKYSTPEVVKSKTWTLIIIIILMPLINYDNFNLLSYYLTSIIQIIIHFFKKSTLTQSILITLLVNIILYPYNKYYNIGTFIFTPILIWIFEKVVFNFVLITFILNIYLTRIICSFFINIFMFLVEKFNYYFNIICYSNISLILIIVSFITIFVYTLYENKRYIFGK